VVEDVVGWVPLTSLAEHDDRGTAEFKNGLLLSALKRCGAGMNLNNTAPDMAPTSTNANRPKLRVSRIFICRSCKD
jgi:hypothetical protein